MVLVSSLLSATVSSLTIAALCASLAPGTAAQNSPSPPNASRPNILFLMCDSMDGRVLDPTSPVSSRVEMPNLRKLASRGVNFINTYAASPQCVPSRTTMFTGRRIDQTKTWNNGQGIAGIPFSAGGGATASLDTTCVNDYDEATCRRWQVEQNISATLLDSLRALRYESHLYGKVDVGAGILQDADETNATCDGYHGGPSLSILTRTADIRKPTKPDPLQITNDVDNHVHEEDWKMLPKCIEFLRRQAALRVGHNEPGDGGTAITSPVSTTNWMLYCSINIPHPAFDTNATWLDYVHDDLVDVPTWLPDETFHPADSYMSISKSVWRNFTKQEVLKVRKTYYAMCAETDFMFGLVLDALKETGFNDNTFIVFLSDHGEMNMEHRQVWKNSMYEASSRVPMMIVPPNDFGGDAWNRGAVVRNLTSLLDVYPTLLEMTQVSATALRSSSPPSPFAMPGFLQGHSLFPFLYKPGQSAALSDTGIIRAYPKNRSVTSQYHSNMGNTGSFMIRAGRWKYTAFGRYSYDKTYTPQLFDLSTDPEELHDLASLTAHSGVVADLDARLRDVVDYPAVEAEARANDVALYKRFFADRLSVAKLKLALKRAYRGFDDADWARLQAWVKRESVKLGAQTKTTKME